MSAVLEVRNLVVQVGDAARSGRAVSDVSFDVQPGEFYGVVGESGSGKTTLLRAVAGLLRRGSWITAGDISVDGRMVVRAGTEVAPDRAKIGVVFQDPVGFLNPVMRVGDQIAEAPRHHRGLSRAESRKVALELMNRVGIPDPNRRSQAYPHQLSGGMNQRVMIAVALSTEPTLLLCDEPTTALDVSIQDQILELLSGLATDFELGVLYVTHDLAVVGQVCERVGVMYGGQFVEAGPVSIVFNNPLHPYTAGLLRSVPTIDASDRRLVPLAGMPPDPLVPLDGCPFHPRCPLTIEDCTSGNLPLLDVDSRRSTACIRYRELQKGSA